MKKLVNKLINLAHLAKRGELSWAKKPQDVVYWMGYLPQVDNSDHLIAIWEDQGYDDEEGMHCTNLICVQRFNHEERHTLALAGF